MSAPLNNAQHLNLRRALRASAAVGALVFAATQVEAAPILLLAAGGGGGAGWSYSTPGSPGQLTTGGASGGGPAGGVGGVLGAGGAGGHGAVFTDGENGAGGAGWFGSGADGQGTVSGSGGVSGPSFKGGLGVSDGYSYLGDGGFGGGGGGGGLFGGGGGGFSGGGGGGLWVVTGGLYHAAAGGGGGSYFSPGAVSPGGASFGNGIDDGAGVKGLNGRIIINGHTYGYTGAVGAYTVRFGGQITIQAFGGEGGGGERGSDSGGYGAWTFETINTTVGEKLYFVAGGAGQGYNPGRTGTGGGGGSFIWTEPSPPPPPPPAPEPESWLLLETGVLGVGFALRRRYARAAL